jgi:hypothetical protein
MPVILLLMQEKQENIQEHHSGKYQHHRSGKEDSKTQRLHTILK